MVRKVTVFGATGQVSSRGRRVAVATGSSASCAGPLGAIIVGTAGPATRCSLDSGGVRGTLRPGVRVA